MLEIRVQGVEELVKRITTIQQLKRVRAAVKMAGHHMQRQMRDYPTNRHGANPMLHGTGTKAQRMRRGFFYHLNKGNISVPYGRTGNLKKRWTVRMDKGLTATVGNNARYASLVQGAGTQTGGHARSGWITEQRAIDRERTTITAYIRDALVREVGG